MRKRTSLGCTSIFFANIAGRLWKVKQRWQHEGERVKCDRSFPSAAQFCKRGCLGGLTCAHQGTSSLHLNLPHSPASQSGVSCLVSHCAGPISPAHHERAGTRSDPGEGIWYSFPSFHEAPMPVQLRPFYPVFHSIPQARLPGWSQLRASREDLLSVRPLRAQRPPGNLAVLPLS